MNQCALCHGIGGVGGKGPALNQPKLKRGATPQALFKVIKEGIPGTEMPEFWMMTDAEIRQVSAYVRSLGAQAPVRVPGNVARGKALYEEKGGCTACHAVAGQGGVSGPDLTEIGLRRSPAHLRSALLAPNAETPEGYLVVTATARDGRRVRGVRVNEDSFSVQIRDGENRFHSFRKSELQELKKEFGVSTMPSYKDVFTAAELDDLIAYLHSLRGEK
jgi:putative heme-binding domain-containing protein